MRKYVFIAVVAFAFAALALARAQGTEVNLRQRAAASPDGRYVTYTPLNTFPAYPDVETLTHLSTDVIIGTAGSNACQLSPNGDFITTNYKVTVLETLKGPLVPGSTVTVSLPGGKVIFGVKSYLIEGIEAEVGSAEVRTPWFKKMEAGKQYYLFLTGSGALNQKYNVGYLETTGGPQGVFELAGGVIKSNSGRLRDPIWRYHNMGAAPFKTAVLNVVASEPTPSCAICP